MLDIADVTNPRLIREMHFSGAYLNSRRIGNAVYSVVIFPEAQITGLKYDINDSQWTAQMCGRDDQSVTEITAEITAKFEVLKVENRELIQAADLSKWLPSVKDLSYNGVPPQENPSPFANCANFYQSGQKDGKSFLAIISTEINGTASLNATTIIGKPGAVYASASAMYVAARHSQTQMSWFFSEDIEEASTIHKFNLTNEPPASQYAGSGVVKGRVLNQFSMDEFNGFFRLATTSGHLPNPKTHSTISILEQQANELVVVGKIDDIAPTEDIRSARFMGDKGYIVTFKKTDPLFVFDLADPFQPKIAGELKIPGFSTYMHRLDANHLLTIGYDADDQGNFAWFTGIMLQIFDVSDMSKPALAYKEVIGSRGSTSEAATNHLAFNYFGSKGLLAIPMTICKKDKYYSGGSYGDMMTFSGLLIYKVSADNGFELVGGVPHIAPESQDNYRRACSNWWTQSNSYVKRSIFMDDYVFSVSEDTIKANNMAALGTDVSVVYFADEPKCDAFHVDLCNVEPDCQNTNGNWNTDSCILPLYSPRRSSRSSNICIANFDPENGDFTIPCINIAGNQYNADMFISSLLPTQLMLNSEEVEPAMIRFAAQDCEVVYAPTDTTVRIPCINNLGDTSLYWADFNVVTDTPLTVELIDFGAVPEN